MITAMDVARYFLTLNDDEAGDNLTNLKIQKLLYYAQGVHLALTDSPLFNEQIEAWQHGPVVPEVYHQFKTHGSNAVTLDVEIDFSKFTDETREILDEVYNVYGQFSAWKLRNMTHEESPWAETSQGSAISRRKLSEFFKTRIIDDGEETT
ncbi:MAG: SocA family protein [Planctomycetes bacterium]|nr:SocA family protein [Planctomycetota bacterium]